MWQCVAACCSVLQRVAVFVAFIHFIQMLQYVAACCSVLQCVAACCSVLNHTLPTSMESQRRFVVAVYLAEMTFSCAGMRLVTFSVMMSLD